MYECGGVGTYLGEITKNLNVVALLTLTLSSYEESLRCARCAGWVNCLPSEVLSAVFSPYIVFSLRSVV